MNILVVGLGSMGKRRIRLMQQMDAGLQIMGVDFQSETRQAAAFEFGITCYGSIEEAFQSGCIEAAFVCTEPLSHSKIILDLLDRNADVFTEINLVKNDYEAIIEKSSESGRIVFLSSTFLYRKDVAFIMDRVKNNRVNYQYHTGQYLPEWYPWESYQNFFVADKRTNGCREIMAIELPWIVMCFGKIKSVMVKKSSMSDLKLDYCDNYMLMLEHENGNMGQIAVDVVSRKPRRTLEVYGEYVQLFWDGTPDSLKEYSIEHKAVQSVATYEKVDKDAAYCDNIIENAYMEEITAFFHAIRERSASSETVRYDFNLDMEILDLIDRIEAGDL